MNFKSIVRAIVSLFLGTTIAGLEVKYPDPQDFKAALEKQVDAYDTVKHFGSFIGHYFGGILKSLAKGFIESIQGSTTGEVATNLAKAVGLHPDAAWLAAPDVTPPTPVDAQIAVATQEPAPVAPAVDAPPSFVPAPAY